MTDALFGPGAKVEFTNAASLLVRAMLAADETHGHKSMELLYRMFKLGGKVQANFGTAYRDVQAGWDEDGEMRAIAVLQKRLAECDFLQEASTGLIVGHHFDRRTETWGSHS